MTRVVILAPVDNSPFSRAIAALTHAEPGLELAGIVVRKILNPKRLRSELRRDGVRLVRKAWKKLVLGSEDGVAEDERGFNDLAREAGMERIGLSAFAKREGIPCVRVGDHNDAETLAALVSMEPTVVAFTGGGIIRPPLIEASGQGIFNTHMGVLPAYRGMDVVEWPILEDRQVSVGLGVSLHFMDKGIDTGPVAKVVQVPIRPGDSVERLRKRFEPVIVEAMMDGLCMTRDGELALQLQRDEDGRQYYVMHPRFYDQVKRRLADRLSKP